MRAVNYALLLSCLGLGIESAAAAEVLQEIVVTGSLIPQIKLETVTPVTVITAEQMKDRGYATVADVLQQSSFATGSVQNAQDTNSFTPGAKTLSMFGLSPSYVKYLIDGLPMSDYPALYNGSDTISSISGIPMELVERIDILPGGQSSIYGSDAIAGVVNIVLKKKLDGPVFDARVGWTQGGGGTEKRFVLADTVSVGKFTLLGGLQYQKADEIWGYQRPLTASYYAEGASAQTAERDYVLYGEFGPQGDGKNAYYFSDPANCANLTSQFGGSLQKYTRAGRGSYCGTKRSGNTTIGNGEESVQGYLRLRGDLNDTTQLYADLLVNHDATRFSYGPYFWANYVDSNSPLYYYYDPNLDDLMNAQRVFSPEEAGGLASTLNKNTTNGYRGTVGAHGALGQSTWTYDVGMSYTTQRLTENSPYFDAGKIDKFFLPLFGPNLGPDPYDFGVSTFAPNYSAFYKALTPAQYASFSGRAVSYSRTEDGMLRGQLTNAALFSLPGGDAGIALVLEGGSQGWEYSPDQVYLNGTAFGFTATSGSGHRSRYAGTGELRLPVLSLLTLTASGRYDDYKVSDGSVAHATYNLGFELRPLRSLLLRGRYGTAFKAPTLADQFQGESGYYQTMTDYYRCANAGYSGATIGDCPYTETVRGSTRGSATLKPITAKVWSMGAVWQPLERLSLTLDYLHWGIDNEVAIQSSDQVLRNESACRLGTLSITSPTCVTALSQVVRDGVALQSVSTPKVNVAREALDVAVMAVSYRLPAAEFGSFQFDGSWSNLLKHDYQAFAGDPVLDLLGDPTWSQEFKSKANASVTWSRQDWSTTLYVSRYGRTPNYLATLNGYDAPGAGKLPAWTVVNLSMRFDVTPAVQVSVVANNVFDKMPPEDHGYPGTTSVPYNQYNYNVYGQSFLLELNYKLGR